MMLDAQKIHPQPEKRRGAWRMASRSIGTAVMLGLVLTGCAGDDEAADAPVGIVSNITARPQEYIGQTVTIRGEVEDHLSPYAFSIDENASLEAGIDDDLLVISAQDDAIVPDDGSVEVRGVIRDFEIPEIEAEVGYDLEDSLFADWGERPVLIATTVEEVAAVE